ncbi:MAG: FkbM family methyltransferase [Phycisphaeraceae bacterium]|nr:FkbM family methyltransferase [Phycisphaeraceae bacterium]
MSHHVPFAAEECALFTRLALAGFDPRVIYDVGSSNGAWSWQVRSVFPDATYHLFDPLTDAEGRYHDETTLAAVRSPEDARRTVVQTVGEQFTQHPIALGNASGQTTLHISKRTAAGSTTLQIHGGEQFETRTVPVRRIDDLIAIDSLPTPDLIKIDTQGSELAILQGAAVALQTCSMLLLETWLYRAYGPTTPLLSELIAFLERRGFVLAHIGHVFHGDDHKLNALDAVFCSPDTLKRFGPVFEEVAEEIRAASAQIRASSPAGATA